MESRSGGLEEPEQQIEISRYDGRGGDGGGRVQRAEEDLNGLITSLVRTSLSLHNPLYSARLPRDAPSPLTPSGAFRTPRHAHLPGCLKHLAAARKHLEALLDRHIHVSTGEGNRKCLEVQAG